MTHAPKTAAAHRWVARFDRGTDLVAAARAARAAGFAQIEAYAPLHLPGLSAAIGFGDRASAALALGGGLLGGSAMYALQWFSVARDYPIDVGGRTPAWPGLLPSTFEMTILGAALALVAGMLVRAGLPRLHHPIFDIPGFESASSDGYFLCICTRRAPDAQAAREFLRAQGSVALFEAGPAWEPAKP